MVHQQNVMRGVRINLPRQTPFDGYHLLIHGFILKLYTLIYFVVLGSDAVRAEFNVRLENFRYPPNMIRITFSLGSKMGKRWGFSMYRTLAQIGPYLLRGLVPTDVLNLTFTFLDLYHIAFAPSLTRASATRALPLARTIVDTVSELWPYDKARKYNIGRPTLHGLLELGRELPLFGSCVLTGVQHEEARHSAPKQDLYRTNKRDVAVKLAKLDAERQGKASVLHGARFSSEYKFDPVGELRAGIGALTLADPSNPNLPHPLKLKITQLSKLSSATDLGPHAQHFLRGAADAKGEEPVLRKQLSRSQDELVREVLQERHRPVAAEGKLDVRLAKQIVIRGELYRLNEDIRVQSGGDLPWIARILEIGSCSPDGGEDVPFCFVRWLKRTDRTEAKMGNRAILVADREPADTVIFAESVLSRAAAFHNCKLSGASKCAEQNVRICDRHENIDCSICPENSGDLHAIFQCCASNREWLLDPYYGQFEI